MNGNNILVYRKIGTTYTPIAATKSNEITVGCDTIEIASPSQGAWKKSIAGRKEWTINVSFLVLNVSTGQNASVTELLNVGTTYDIQFAGRNAAGGVAGTAILTQCKITATKGNLAVGSFVFTGISALTS